MKDNPLESYIERKVCEYAKSEGMIHYKFTSPSRRSVPDRLFIFKGITFYIEFKRLGCKLTTAQKKEVKIIRDAGATVKVIDNVAEGVSFINSISLENSLNKYKEK